MDASIIFNSCSSVNKNDVDKNKNSYNSLQKLTANNPLELLLDIWVSIL